MRSDILAVSMFAIFAASAAQADPPRGHDDYVRYCSACHGEAADGKGPVANALQPPPPPLTRLHGRFGTPLTTKFVVYVMGKNMPRAHGASDMPVWGRNLEEAGADEQQARQTIWRIADYLDSIQSEK